MGLDIGTTHIKAMIFRVDGTVVCSVSRPMETYRTDHGHSAHDPEQLWRHVASAIREALQSCSGEPVTVVGVCSMAEAGVLLNRRTGEPTSEIIPWFDTRAASEADGLAQQADPIDLFRRTGLRPSFKYGLPKILWLQKRDPTMVRDAIWLSVADYVVYRMTARQVTDPTLAARTYAFAIADGSWDESWIEQFGLQPALFPEVQPSGVPAGVVTDDSSEATGLASGTPVAVAGHDHICAMAAVGITTPGPVLDSVGTAESMMGVLVELDLTQRSFESGLAIVPHVLPGRFCWLGGLSSAGGSIEWLRSHVFGECVSHESMLDLLQGVPEGPTGIVYVPYLYGSGAPHPDQRARGALINLSADHGRGDLLRAVLEGTAYAAESIRRCAAALTQSDIAELVLVGGGASNSPWAQIKADITGCTCLVPMEREASAFGAALVAALGSGFFSTESELRDAAHRSLLTGTRVWPRPLIRERYRSMYESVFLPVEETVRRYAGITW